ncbi:hypothetical protein [Bacteroides ovatus]|uniref:hypothetical protein n=1 Tax=Bacteroides ovatus TaxID=28116 RepID=UPI0021656F1B|nr:hypothetical protein [Bacteroides ovatus]MCS3242760.1 hypothetical protein [Bacteroides ovatus]
MKYIPSILLFFFLLSFSSCSTKTVESELPEPNPPTPVIPEEPTPEKEKMLWFDAEANFERFSKKRISHIISISPNQQVLIKL